MSQRHSVWNSSDYRNQTTSSIVTRSSARIGYQASGSQKIQGVVTGPTNTGIGTNINSIENTSKNKEKGGGGLVGSRLHGGGGYTQPDWPDVFGINRFIGVISLMKTLHGYLRTFLVFASKVWTCICYIFKKQTRAVRQFKTIRYSIDSVPLSPLSRHRLKIVRRKVLILDLDETLIHSNHDGNSGAVQRSTVKPGTPPDFILKVTIDRHPVRFFVHKRPHVDFFLNIVSKWYELVVFTASMEIYGTAVADKLDTKDGILRRRYYRQHCTLDFGSYTKDLSAICSDLSSVFILDNSPGAYRAYPDNAIPIKSWFNDPTDTALLNLLPVLDALRFVSDVRSVLSRNREAHRNWNR